MLKTTTVAVALLCWAAAAQDAKTALEAAAKAMGAGDLKSIEYAGSGASFTLGQNVSPAVPWPRVEVKSYRRAIDYATPASREEITRPQGTAVQLVAGNTAWNMAGNNPAPAPTAVVERLTQVWLTPHGFLKGALANNATAKSSAAGGRKVTTISFLAHGKQRVSGVLNDQNLVEKVETTIANPVLGDMPVEVLYSEYRDFGGVKFPGKIVQRAGGFPTLELTVNEVRPNAAVKIDPPQAMRGATAPPIRVETAKLAEGVWYLTGGSHHSLAVEFKDHVTVIEGPLNDDRSRAVMAEVKKTVPSKPIRYLINTHHHFDHSGGLRAYVEEGVKIVTHKINQPFYAKAFGGGKRKPSLVTFTGKRVFTDGTQTLELHHIQGNPHNEGILMAYFPKHKLLAEVDVYTPAAPNAPAPATPSPASVNLYENIQRLKLDVAQIAALHGRAVPLAELEKAIGKAK